MNNNKNHIHIGLNAIIILLILFSSCTTLTDDVFLQKHPRAREATAVFEGFRSVGPYYCLVVDSLHTYPHLVASIAPVVDEGNDSYNGLSFKAYYDPDNIKSYEIWVCMDELILPSKAEYKRHMSARLCRVFRFHGYVMVKYQVEMTHEDGSPFRYHCEEYLPNSYFTQLKTIKKSHQQIDVKVYSNPINPYRPIFLIDRELIENAPDSKQERISE